MWSKTPRSTAEIVSSARFRISSSVFWMLVEAETKSTVPTAIAVRPPIAAIRMIVMRKRMA